MEKEPKEVVGTLWKGQIEESIKRFCERCRHDGHCVDYCVFKKYKEELKDG